MTRPISYDVLYNFISPVTGRILCDTDYVLVGNAEGIAIPSPILIPILPLINMIESLPTTDFVIGHPNIYLPAAQVLSTMTPSEGFVYSTSGTVTIKDTVPLTNLPDLTENYIWRGDATNRPVESDYLTVLGDDFYTYKPNLLALPLGVPHYLTEVYDAFYDYFYFLTPIVVGVPNNLDVILTASIAHTNEINMINVALTNAPADNLILLGVNGTGNYPIWSTTTYPATIAQYSLLYGSATNVIGEILTVPNSVLTTDSLGVPSWTSGGGGAVSSVTGTANQITASPTTGAVVLSLPTDVQVSNSITTGFIEVDRAITSSGAPTITQGSAGVIGTGATSSIAGGELGGVFTLNTGTAVIPLAGGIAITFTLPSAMPTSASIIFCPASDMDIIFYVIAISTTDFTLTIGNGGVLLPSSTYKWNYQIIGY